MGFYSWMTADTKESIANRHSNRCVFSVVMVLPDGRKFLEENYEGYGKFGGKDYYEALAEINGMEPDRIKGIALAHSGKKILWPQLVRNPVTVQSFASPNEACPQQGFFYDEYD